MRQSKSVAAGSCSGIERSDIDSPFLLQQARPHFGRPLMKFLLIGPAPVDRRELSLGEPDARIRRQRAPATLGANECSVWVMHNSLPGLNWCVGQ